MPDQLIYWDSHTQTAIVAGNDLHRCHEVLYLYMYCLGVASIGVGAARVLLAVLISAWGKKF